MDANITEIPLWIIEGDKSFALEIVSNAWEVSDVAFTIMNISGKNIDTLQADNNLTFFRRTIWAIQIIIEIIEKITANTKIPLGKFALIFGPFLWFITFLKTIYSQLFNLVKKMKLKIDILFCNWFLYHIF